MGSSEEMFERGVRDAERDELNAFYYQHYFHYRQGYDRARRRLRQAANNAPSSDLKGRLSLLGGGLLALCAVILFAFTFWGRGDDPTARATDSIPTAVVQEVIPTRIPRAPTATPEPVVEPTAPLEIERIAVVVNLNGDPLRVRAEAGTSSAIVARIPEGSEVKLLEGPTEADGYTWWKVEAEQGTGWVAERSQEGVLWLQPK
jgi:Bacterial SH3 domain.